jgi:hypothetical protein
MLERSNHDHKDGPPVSHSPKTECCAIVDYGPIISSSRTIQAVSVLLSEFHPMRRDNQPWVYSCWTTSTCGRPLCLFSTSPEAYYASFWEAVLIEGLRENIYHSCQLYVSRALRSPSRRDVVVQYMYCSTIIAMLRRQFIIGRHASYGTTTPRSELRMYALDALPTILFSKASRLICYWSAMNLFISFPFTSSMTYQ